MSVQQSDPKRESKPSKDTKFEVDRDVYGIVQDAENVNQTFNIFVRDSIPSLGTPTSVQQIRRISFSIEQGDVTTFDADLLALKYASTFYGADRAVASALGRTIDKIIESIPNVDNYHISRPLGKIKAQKVLFLNVGNLFEFDYEKIWKFASDILRILAQDAPMTRHLAMTIHGVGYGLDETEVLRSQLGGYLDALESGNYPSALEQITIVEMNSSRVERLSEILKSAVPDNTFTLYSTTQSSSSTKHTDKSSSFTEDAGYTSSQKPYVLVAIPPSQEETDDYGDIFYFGIYQPVTEAGYLCEKISLSLKEDASAERIRSRIEKTSLLIAELTDKNPTVFLTLGYTLGKNRPTILLFDGKIKEVPADIFGQQCLVYRGIRNLRETLSKELQLLNGIS